MVWGLSFMFIRKMANPGKVVSRCIRWLPVVGLGPDTTGPDPFSLNSFIVLLPSPNLHYLVYRVAGDGVEEPAGQTPF